MCENKIDFMYLKKQPTSMSSQKLTKFEIAQQKVLEGKKFNVSGLSLDNLFTLCLIDTNVANRNNYLSLMMNPTFSTQIMIKNPKMLVHAIYSKNNVVTATLEANSIDFMNYCPKDCRLWILKNMIDEFPILRLFKEDMTSKDIGILKMMDIGMKFLDDRVIYNEKEYFHTKE